MGTSETLDLNRAITDPASGWKLGVTPDLNVGRGHFNTTLLPDGSILSNGGGIGRKDDTLYADPVYQAELMEPGSPWRLVGSEDDARTYHSTALLLPDGSVVVGGRRPRHRAARRRGRRRPRAHPAREPHRTDLQPAVPLRRRAAGDHLRAGVGETTTPPSRWRVDGDPRTSPAPRWSGRAR